MDDLKTVSRFADLCICRQIWIQLVVFPGRRIHISRFALVRFPQEFRRLVNVLDATTIVAGTSASGASVRVWGRGQGHPRVLYGHLHVTGTGASMSLKIKL